MSEHRGSYCSRSTSQSVSHDLEIHNAATITPQRCHHIYQASNTIPCVSKTRAQLWRCLWSLQLACFHPWKTEVFYGLLSFSRFLLLGFFPASEALRARKCLLPLDLFKDFKGFFGQPIIWALLASDRNFCSFWEEWVFANKDKSFFPKSGQLEA